MTEGWTGAWKQASLSIFQNRTHPVDSWIHPVDSWIHPHGQLKELSFPPLENYCTNMEC